MQCITTHALIVDAVSCLLVRWLRKRIRKRQKEEREKETGIKEPSEKESEEEDVYDFDEAYLYNERDYDSMLPSRLTSTSTSDDSEALNYWRKYFGYPVTPPHSPNGKETQI